jgi:hypothetical protein
MVLFSSTTKGKIMNITKWVGLFCVSVLAACSEGNIEQVPDKASEASHPSLLQLAQMDEQSQQTNVDSDCAGFEAIIALLPDQLSGEATSEQYYSCDPVTPTAISHFTSDDQITLWTFSITVRDLESPAGKMRWDITNTDQSQNAFIRKGVKAAVAIEALLFDNCVNNLQLSGLPEWHKTNRLTVDPHDVCIGTDAQMIEDGGWVARAKSVQYLYALRVEGDKAAQFANAQEATDYLSTLFRQFR